jgi:hypothetical protein
MPKFKRHFDIVLVNDQTMNVVNGIQSTPPHPISPRSISILSKENKWKKS